MAGSSGNNQLKVYDNKTYQPLTAVIDLGEGVYGADFANKSDTVAFGCGDGLVYIVNIVNGVLPKSD